MTQTERENSTLWQRYAQQAAAQASAAAQAESARAQAEQLSRKLAAARAEVRRYQTRMFAFERTFLALKHENAELEAACEQAREEAEQADFRAEQAERARQEAELALAALQQATAAQIPPEVRTEPGPVQEPIEPEPQVEAPAVSCNAVSVQHTAAPEEPVWEPRTELEHLSVQLIAWFDAMMPQV